MPQSPMHPSHIKIEDYTYPLPEERIAKFPLPERDQSKLLVYKNGAIEEAVYRHLDRFIPSNSLMLFNQAKVIHARLHFKKITGGKLEIFCLEPDEQYPDITTAMLREGEVYWKCFIKGAAKWKGNEKLTLATIPTDWQQEDFQMTAEKIKRVDNAFILRFNWSARRAISFSELLQRMGEIPIPPYLKREAEASDEDRYQTIFAKEEGSVAAPTAALHFTPNLVTRLLKKGVRQATLTLHVGAGTFMPVKSKEMEGHIMHSEWIEVEIGLIEQLMTQIEAQKGPVIAVGTTSARTLESLYWIGCRLLSGEQILPHEIAVSQWYPYEETGREILPLEALKALQTWLLQQGRQQLITQTQIIIASGYRFRMIDALITNFHQPASTLILMIAAFAGEDWREIYDYALSHQFRFLSYGDGSLLWRSGKNQGSDSNK